ncbi:MAG: 3,4-dihydroxy-2-butanone-4-phosphate synthase [Lysobacterales bacterium CG02_land_8_20_14_3_00_62_12]|nr:MAG: 3,4-dihydroxy-2-butanone-4-phosphate synthase [Xanthomonadales bacterium CG02_land_8_20_14_3_00_62_12]
MSFASIPELLDELRAGRMVVMLDDEDRENEGDLIMAASLVRPADINFMVTHARGLICLALDQARCQKLQLPLMVADNQARYRTAFTVSIEAASGVTTGISAFDRAHTIRTAVAADAGPQHLHRPGHVFPLMAEPGGVLARAGHTEAAVDLTALAGLPAAGVLVEIMAEDGHMARRPELETYARRHHLKLGTIAALIRYRQTLPASATAN